MKRFLTLPLAVAGAATLQAQDLPQAEYELVTTAIHTRSSETALPVTVLSGEALRDAARATLGDTLANQPGINNASFGPAVGQTVIRGQQGRRVMHLTNGIPNADASGNSADHALSVEPILADTVEVLRGPSTLLYGGGAIGGVVNVIDNRIPGSLPAAPSLRLEARHDTAADQDNLVGRLEFATGDFAWHLDALRREWNDLDIPGFAIDPLYLEAGHGEHGEHEEEEGHGEEVENTFGYVANSGGKTESATLGASYVFAKGFVGFSASRLENFYGLPRGAHDHAHGHDHHDHDHDHDHGHEAGGQHAHGGEAVFVDMRRTRYDLRGEWRDLGGFLENIRYSASWSDYRHEELEDAALGTRFDNESWQHRLQLTHRELGGWHGVLGWQRAREEFGAVGAESFIPVTALGSDGLFLVEDYHLDRLTLELGARLGRDTLEPKAALARPRDFSTHSLSASALIDLGPALSLGLSWARSERAPSVEELYSNYHLADSGDCVIHFATGACEIGNAGFDTEKSRNTDLSLYFERGGLNATLTLFHNSFDDYIFQADTGLTVDGFAIREYRQSGATFTGVELDAGYRFNDGVELRFFADTLDGSLEGHGDAPRMPPARAGSTLTFRGLQWSAYVSVLRAWDQDEAGMNELPTKGYTRWDLGLDYVMETGGSGELTLFAKGRNLGNEEIRLSTSYLRSFAPEAGRSLELGMRYAF